MKQRTDSQGVPYSYLVDNIKVVLIFLVVFNHLIAFQLVKVDMVVRYVWYGITIFHMPAFIFISGYLSKKPQDVLKNVKNLLIPYILGYSLTWYAYIWTGRSMDYELLRPSGTVMWYVLALFIYRLTIEALGKIRFIVPLSIIFALWAGTRPEFTTYLSSSRIVVFFPFFVAGYLWKSDYTDVVRKFKGKWILLLVSALLLYAVPNFMIANEIARKKIADALIDGYPLRIEGGDFRICDGQSGNCSFGGCYKQEIYKKYAAEKGEGIMRIAVTYENGQIFQHFGHTETFKIYDVEEGKVVHSEVVDTNGSGHGALAGVLNALNADVLICGGIGGGAQTALAAAGIKLFGGVSGDADEAVEAFINETLEYNPDVKCSHHEHNHGEGHTCGEHGCGSHSCH